MPGSAGAEVARLLLRATVGGTMIAHGVKHARSLKGTASWFESIGFRKPELQARLSAAVEIGAGSAIALGLATPLAASAVIGTMTVASETVHRPNGFFITAEGYEYVLVLSSASAAVAALGGGRYSVDRLVGADRRLTGLRGAALAIGLGVAGAAGQLATFWRRPQS